MFNILLFFLLCYKSQPELSLAIIQASLVAQLVKNPPAMGETWVQSLSWDDPLEEVMATHSSILAWRIPMDRGTLRAMVHEVSKSQTHMICISILFYNLIYYATSGPKHQPSLYYQHVIKCWSFALTGSCSDKKHSHSRHVFKLPLKPRKL